MAKKELIEKMEIPKGINVEISGNKITVSKDGKKVEKILPYEVKKKGNELIVGTKKLTKRNKSFIKTTIAHIKNILKGFEEEYVYELKICHVHFPVTISSESDKVIIKNFLGERTPRETKILPGVDVKIEKDKITVKSFDKEKAGQTAANIEKATYVKKRDRRIFQDGCYIISKPGDKNE